MGQKVVLSPGTVFSRWTILGENPIRVSSGGVQYFVKCECGFESSVVAYALYNGTSTQCKECQYKTMNAHRAKYPNVGPVHGSYLNSLTRHARTRNLKVNITVGDLAAQWQRQESKCALTGWVLTLKERQHQPVATASVDRIDSSRGYSVDNIQWVHKWVNRAKMDLTEERFFEICRAVAEHKEETKRLRRPWNIKI